MKKMNRIAALVLALIMCLGMMGTAAASERQITKQGQEVSVEKGAVKLSKTIAGTETENVFDITLKVTTSENLEEIATSPNTAVVLVIDSSSSMIHNNYGDNTRLYAAKESARSFVDSYVKDYQKQVQSDPDLVRKLAVVNFDSTSYTTYKMEQLKADSAAATATAVKAAIGDPSKDVPNTDSYGPYYGTFDGISVHGGTNIEAGLTTAKDLLDKSGVPQQNQYIILLSDGQPSRWIGSTSTNPKNHSSHSRVTNEQGTAIGDVLYDSVNVYSVYIAGANDTIDDCSTPECAYEGEKVTTWLGRFSHIVSTPGKPDELTKFFERISKLITVYANAWTVNDPMGEYIEFDSVTANADHTSFKDNNLKWNLRLDEPVVDATVTPTTYTYEMTYRVKLDNLAEGFVAGVANPTNGSTVLDYFMSENRDDPDPKLEQANFDVPAVKGLVGSLEFNKVDDQYNPLSGAKFTLTINEDGETWSTTATSTNGKVSFTNIPSGHKYTLTETFTPDGYVSANPIEVEVSFGKTYIDEKAITEEAPLTVVNDRMVAQVTVTKSFVNLPEELWPEITITLTNTEDETKSYFATLPENDETPWVADIEVAAPGTYTVSEEPAVVEDWALIEKDHPAEVTVVIGEQKSIDLVNTYEKVVGDLTITKTFAGDGVDVPNDLSFTITGDNFSQTVSYTEFTDGSYTLSDLDLGNYTVTESGAGVENYTLTTTYKVNGESANAGSVELTKNDATIEIINTYEQDLGTLVIEKSFSGDEVTVPANLSFTITGPYDYSATVAYTEFENGSYTIKGLPVGEYTVTESNTSVAGHSVVTTYKVNGKETSTAAVIRNGSTNIEVDNDYTKIIGDLVITKTFAGDTVAVPENLSFTITGDNFSQTVSYTEFTDGSYTLSDLALGQYTVTESNALVTDYTLTTSYKVNGESANAGSVELTKNDATIEIINTYEQDLGTLVIEKSFSGDEVTVPANLSFTITGPYDYSATVAYTEFENGSYTIKGLPVGEYTVTESNTSVAGHSVVTTYKVNGKETSTAAVIKNGSANIEVDNDYTKIIGNLIVTKDVAGDLTEEDFDGKSITFTVSGPEGYTGPASFTLPESDDNPWAWSISDVPLGTYTIAESGADVNDYNLTTSFMVNGKAADTATVDLTKAGATIDITNTYSMKVGSLTITKRNNGTTPEEVTLTVTGPHEFSEEVVLNANSWTKTFENLPIGTYTVTEDKEAAKVTGYTLTVTGEGDVNVTEGEIATIAIENNYSANPGVLKLVKKIEKDQGNPQVEYVELQVSGKTTNGDPFSQTVTLNKGNKWQATIDIPAGKYTVAETDQSYADEYFSLTETKWDQTDVTVLPGQTEISESNTVTCTNIYTLGEAASLEIPVRKIVERGEGGNTDPAGERVFQFKMTIDDYISPRGKVLPGEYEVTFGGQKLTPAHGVYTFNLVVDGSGSAEDLLKITANPADLRDKKITITELSQTESGYAPNNAWTYDETVYEAYTYYEGDDGFGVNLSRSTEPDEKWDGVTAEFKNLYTFVTEEPPKTGDNSQLGLWMALMVLSAAGFVFTMKRRSAQN